MPVVHICTISLERDHDVSQHSQLRQETILYPHMGPPTTPGTQAPTI